VTHTYAPLQRWSCDKCGGAGELGSLARLRRYKGSLPNRIMYGASLLAFAERLHKVASPECDGVVRVTQETGQYSD